MPLYFFHVRDGEHLSQDTAGTELPDLNAAFEEAQAAAREIAADCLRANEPVDGRVIEIAGPGGEVFGELRVKAVIEK